MLKPEVPVLSQSDARARVERLAVRVSCSLVLAASVFALAVATWLAVDAVSGGTVARVERRDPIPRCDVGEALAWESGWKCVPILVPPATKPSSLLKSTGTSSLSNSQPFDYAIYVDRDDVLLRTPVAEPDVTTTALFGRAFDVPPDCRVICRERRPFSFVATRTEIRITGRPGDHYDYTCERRRGSGTSADPLHAP